MRITVFLLLFSVIQVMGGRSYSQNTRLSLNLKDVSIVDVLDEIENQSEFFFLFNQKLVNVDRKVDINAKNKQIKDILADLFTGEDVNCLVMDRQIVLSPKNITETVNVTRDRQPQEIVVTGKVTDEDGNPLPGVNIIIKGTLAGTITNVDGNFSIEVDDPEAVLVFTFIGMLTQEIKVGDQTEINITMARDVIGLEEVVAIGYGTIKKSDITGSVSSIKTDDFNQGVNTSVEQLFYGKIAGARVIQNTGEPGGGISLNIRGASSINAGINPLYVIDGVPMDNTVVVSGGGTLFSSSFMPRSPLGTINPSDIESIEILKDASASAIYGARAANGVVLITTKTGKSGKLTIDYDAYVGIQNPSYKYDLLSPEEYMTTVNALIDAGAASEAERVTDIVGGGTDWQEEIFNRNSIINNHNLAISGGSEATKYRASFSYLTQPGVIINNDFKRYTARINLDHNTDVVKLGLRLNNTYTDEKYIPYGTGYNEWAGVINSALNYDPTLPVKGGGLSKDEEGKYSLSRWIQIDNPLALAEGISSKSNRHRTFGNFFVEYFINPSFSVKLNIGADNTSEFRNTYLNRLSLLGLGTGGTGSNLSGNRSNYLLEGFANYKKNFGKNSINALAGLTTQKFTGINFFATAAKFPSDGTAANNLALGDPSFAQVNSNKTSYTLNSYFGRINYSMLDRYLLTATFRADGSSRFGENNKYGFFPSFAAAWKVSNEEFIKKIKAINSLKLRISYGETGNQNIGNYASLSTFKDGPFAVFDDNVTGTAISSRIPNPNLKWETTTKTNFGVDFGLFNSRLTGTVDYFDQKTSDMLINLPIPISTGYKVILMNVGSIRNKGWEFSFTSHNIIGSILNWKTDFNISSIKNKVLDIGNIDKIVSGSSIIKVGEALSSFYGYEVIGTWQLDDDFSVTEDNSSPGSIKFRDVNGDKKITADDRVILGNSFPKLTLGISNTITYKNFYFDILVEGVGGVKKLNINVSETFAPTNFRRNKIAEPYLNRWTTENPTNEYPSFVDPVSVGTKAVNSSYTIMDASYVKLTIFQFGYNFPKLGKTFKSATIYLTGQNLFVISNFIGDPSIDTSSNVSHSVTKNAYPLPRIFMLGIKINI